MSHQRQQFRAAIEFPAPARKAVAPLTALSLTMIASVMTMSPTLESKMLFDFIPRRKTRGGENEPDPKRKVLLALYGPGVDREAILGGKVPIPEPARDLVAEIGRYKGQQKSARNTGS